MWILVIAGVALVNAQGYNYPTPSAALQPNQYNYQIPTSHGNNGYLLPQNQYTNEYLSQHNPTNNVQTPLTVHNHNQYNVGTSYYHQTHPQQSSPQRSSNNQQVHSGYSYNAPQLSNAYSTQQTGRSYVPPQVSYNQQSRTYNTQQQVASNYDTRSSSLGQSNSLQSASYSYKDDFNLPQHHNALNALRPALAPSESFGAVLHQPVVTKHIYFHIPPAEIEEPTKPLPPPAAKKNYKIIFIKVPSQESRHSAVLQQRLQAVAAEERTLIYVLVRKPEAQEYKPVEVVTSKPEVYYVKYNHKTPLSDVVNQITE